MKKKLNIIIFIIALIAFIGAAIYLFMYFNSGSAQSNYKKPTESSTQSSIGTTTKNLADNPVDWDKLQEVNQDIYAWITIPNTNVDYAIVQAGDDKDDSFYLNHNIKGDYEFAGSIYSEKQNLKDFLDPVTLLYGHNMLNGSMFASLHKFEDSKFFKENTYMYVYTPGHKLTYEIYAAYVYDDRHILNSFDFQNVEIRMNYFKTTLNPDSMTKNIRKKIKLTKNSKILTLSTCTSGAETTRYLVQGVLIKDEQSE